MILKVKKEEQYDEIEEKETEYVSDKNYLEYLKIIFIKYKYIILILFLLLLICLILLFLRRNNNTGIKNIIIKDSILLYENEKENFDIEFKSVDDIHGFKYNISIDDHSIVKIGDEKRNKNIIQIGLIPTKVGKTKMLISGQNEYFKLNKKVDLIVCKKITYSTLSSDKIFMRPGVSSDILFDVGDLNECKSNLKILVDDESVIKVNNNTIKSLKEGKTTLTIEQNDNKINIDVVVSNDIKLIEDIEFGSTDINIVVGDKYFIPFNVKPSDSDNKYLIWTSSNNNIVTVTQNGILEPKKNGKAIISVTSIDNPSLKKSVNVIVSNSNSEKNNVKEINFKSQEIRMSKGKTQLIDFELLPNSSEYKSIFYDTDNNDIVSVDNSGKIKANNEGETFITIKVTNFDNTIFENKIKIIVVKEYIKAQKITINGDYFLDYGKKYKIDYDIYPSNATIKSISFKSSDPDIVSVSNDGVLTVKDDGDPKIYITITNMDGSKVEENTRVMVRTNVKLISPKVKNITSKSADFSATIMNEYNRKIKEIGIFIWKSNESQPDIPIYKISNISSNSKSVNFLGDDMKISLLSNTEYKYKMYMVIDNNKYYTSENSFKTLNTITSITFKRKYAAVSVDSTYSLPIQFDANDSDLKPRYISKDTNVVTVNSNGVIKGISTGETVVTASYGKISASIIVRVVASISKNNPAIAYDLSEYNTITNWSSIKSNNINHLILRLGITSSFNGNDARVDKMFDNYVKNARANNIEIGVYYFSKANSLSVARNEANFVLKTLNNYAPGTFSLPIYIDYEQNNLSFDKNGIEIINEFCNIITKGGYYCGAYTYFYMFVPSKVNASLNSSVKSYWVPDWTCGGKYKNNVSNLGVWQYAAPDSSSCSHPTVYGVKSADSNYIYVNYPLEIINSGLNNFK